MKIVDIANEIYIDNGSPSTTSLPAIAFWIRGKIGTLNILLYEDFRFENTTQEIIDCGRELSFDAVAIIKQLYRIYDLEVQIRQQMNAINTNDILKIEDQGTAITKVNRNMVSLTLMQVRRDELKMLDKMIIDYRMQDDYSPLDVSGDDTVPAMLWPYNANYTPYARS